MQIPIYCPVCRKFYPGPIEMSAGAKLHIDDVTSNCPRGHKAHFLDGTYSIQDGLLTIFQKRPEVLQIVKDLANQGLSGEIEPATAVSKIGELVPEIAPTFKEAFESKTTMAILSLLSLVVAIIGLLLPSPQNIKNNYYDSKFAPPPKVSQSFDKQQAKKKDMRKAQRKARRIGRAARRR